MSAEPQIVSEKSAAGLKWGGSPSPVLGEIDRIEHRRTIHTCKLPPNATAEDLLRTDFWRLVSKHLNRHDIVYAISSDEDWECECRVEASFPEGAEVSVVRKMKRRAVVQRQTSLGDGKYTTRYQNGTWCVVRVSDQRVMREGFGSENAAILHWLREQPRQV